MATQKKETFKITFSTKDFEKFAERYPNFRWNYRNFREFANSFIAELKDKAKGYGYTVSAKRTTGAKKIYLLFEEKHWDSGDYTDVIGAFESKEDALRALLNYRNDYVQEHEEDWNDAKNNPYNWTIVDEPEHFQMLDEGMGGNYELMVVEQELV